MAVSEIEFSSVLQIKIKDAKKKEQVLIINLYKESEDDYSVRLAKPVKGGMTTFQTVKFSTKKKGRV